MPIIEKEGVFTLQTKNTTYQFKVGDFGYLYHLYYGRKIDSDMSYLVVPSEHGFSGVCDDAGKVRNLSMDILPQEYPSTGVGDFRFTGLGIINNDGSRAIDLRYFDFKVTDNVFVPEGLPHFHGNGETLFITLKDRYTEIYVDLVYKVFADYDVITRSIVVRNLTKSHIYIDKIMSLVFDYFPNDNTDIISFYGAHIYERNFDRQTLSHKNISVGSTRGTSSHHQNPFVIVANSNTSEDYGECFSLGFVYSGNFIFNAEKDHLEQVRIAMGINPEGFKYKLLSNRTFCSPEVALCYSDRGLGTLTNRWHKAVESCLLRKFDYSPVLINNWEATYFDFDDKKLYSLAKKAKSLGIEMLVIDDGWFNNRNNDESGLGDWDVNLTKFPNGLADFSAKIHELGLKLGMWFEPEMVSEASKLYETHPNYVLKIPGRNPMRSRYQLVLNLGNNDVILYLYERITHIIEEAKLDYIKWDMNRSISDLYDANLAVDEQGSVAHNYVLGLYRLLDMICKDYPHLRIESCSGGGGRFDLGMLYYTPQIWSSDNTDAISRLKIQYGTSFGYPIRANGSHVSICPNHQTLRTTPFKTRGYVAYQGTFGYELNILNLESDEINLIKKQIKDFKKYRKIICDGDYYRLSSPYTNTLYTATQFVLKDKSLVFVVFTDVSITGSAIFLKLKGLNPTYRYSVNGKIYKGEQLLYSGIYIKKSLIPFDSILLEIKKVN